MRTARRLTRFAREVLFPHRCPFCDDVLGFAPACTECAEKLPPHARPAGRPLSGEGRELSHLAAVHAPFYYEDLVQHAILRMKFSDRQDLAISFAAFQAAALRAAQAAPMWDAVCFVPSSAKELRRRGCDIPGHLARELACLLERPVVRALCKKRETPRQMTLTGQQRRKNLRGAFAVPEDIDVKGLRLLLVDDVVTTGSTMNECAKTLLAAGAASCTGVGIAAVRTGAAQEP